MTPRQFFTGRAIVFGIVIGIGIGFFVYKVVVPLLEKSAVETRTPPATIATNPPIFSWRFEKSESLNLDGLPETEVYLDATYSGKVISKLVMTAPGGCNDLEEREKDSVSDSTVAQCYAAGYGDRFKVTKGAHSYLVKHKVFEEAMPDYNPPEQPYEILTEFPLSV